MKNISLWLIVYAIMAMSGGACKKQKGDVTLDANLLKSKNKYAELVANRNLLPAAAFSIENISRAGDQLTVTVKGGCQESDYQVVWDGQIMLSYPSRVRLVLHEARASTCEGTVNITVNLSKIIGRHEPKDYVFHVANGSLKQDKSLYPDGSVSSN